MVCCSLLLAAWTTDITGQEGIYYYGSNSKPVELEQDAQIYKSVEKKSNKKFIVQTFKKSDNKWVKVQKEKIKVEDEGSLVIFQSTDSYFPKKIYRKMEEIEPNVYEFSDSDLNNPIRTGTSSRFLPLHLEGIINEYHPYGELKSRSLYRDNQLISNENWLRDGSKYIDSIFYSVDVEPEYQMGDSFFKAFLMKKIGGSGIDLTQIEDLVVIGWVVMEDGSIDGVTALKGKAKQLNEFLVKTILELPGYWTPAILEGEKVRYFMSIPLNFRQNNANFQEVELTPGGMMDYSRY